VVLHPDGPVPALPTPNRDPRDGVHVSSGGHWGHCPASCLEHGEEPPPSPGQGGRPGPRPLLLAAPALLLTSTGEAAEHFGSRLGRYELLEELHGGNRTYRQKDSGGWGNYMYRCRHYSL
jgi:hypothetical protein